MGKVMGQGDLYGGAVCCSWMACVVSVAQVRQACPMAVSLSRHQQADQHVMPPRPLWEDVAS